MGTTIHTAGHPAKSAALISNDKKPRGFIAHVVLTASAVHITGLAQISYGLVGRQTFKVQYNVCDIWNGLVVVRFL